MRHPHQAPRSSNLPCPVCCFHAEASCGDVQLSVVPGVTIYGPLPSRGRAALASFNVEGLHATDVSTLLDTSGAGPVLQPA